MSCKNLQLIQNRSQTEYPWQSYKQLLSGVGKWGLIAGYKSILQIRWVQTLQQKQLFLGTTSAQACSVKVPLPWETRASPPFKTIGHAEMQTILIPTLLLNPGEFLLWGIPIILPLYIRKTWSNQTCEATGFTFNPQTNPNLPKQHSTVYLSVLNPSSHLYQAIS